MKQTRILISMALVSIMFVGCNQNTSTKTMDQDSASIQQLEIANLEGLHAANDAFYYALNTMFKGELEPMAEIWSHNNNTTIMSPFGGRITGWDSIGAEFKREAAMKFGGRVMCKDLHLYVGTNMGYAVCIEEGENMTTDGKPVVVNHRATNIFQIQEGNWKLVHHHTDESVSLEKAYQEDKK